MKYILYVYEQGQLPGLEVWGALGVKLQVLQLRARFPGQTFRHNRIAQVVEQGVFFFSTSCDPRLSLPDFL